MLDRHSVDKDLAAEYISEQLEEGRDLTKLMRDLDLASGDAWTYVPPGTSRSNATDLAYGVISPPVDEKYHIRGENYVAVPVVNLSRPLFIELILRFLGALDGLYCVFEDALVDVSNPAPIMEAAPYVIYRDTLLYYADRQFATTESISYLLSVVESYRLLGVFSQVKDGENILQNGRRLSVDDLLLITSNVQGMLLLAYDGEGYLLWAKETIRELVVGHLS